MPKTNISTNLSCAYDTVNRLGKSPTTLPDNNKQEIFCIYYKHQQILHTQLNFYIYILLYIHTIHTLHFIIHTLYYYKVLYKVSTYTLNQQAPILYRLKINRALHPNTIYKSNTIYTNIPLTNNIISTCIY